MRILSILCLAGVAACAAAPAQAAPSSASPSDARWTIYAGKLIGNDLPPFAYDVLRNRLEWRNSYFVGGSYLQPVATPDWLARAFASIGLSDITTGVEYIGLEHFHNQHNPEVDIAYMIHSRYATFAGVNWRAGGGMGPSLALGRPSAEDGPENAPDKRSRFQNYIGLEVEASLPDRPDIAAVLRLHHRSGAYGLIAPDGVGSNFVTLGLRFAY